jgi:predicted 2-oxoglutarate/Fe(II)-dependent dioxygenase YbiX
MIIELPNYVDIDFIEEIKNNVTPFIPTETTHRYYRDGKSVYISKTPELQALDNKLQNFFSLLGKEVIRPRYTPQYKSGDTGYEYHIYEPGQICHTHFDGEVASGSNPNNEAVSCLRYASVVVHLNTPKDGGEIVFPAQNKKIKTEAGKVVIFPPYGMYQHYTTPSDDPREVLVTWFVYSNVSVYVDGA